MKMWYVYSLSVEGGQGVRYIGVTSQPLEKRLHEHMNANTELGVWIRAHSGHIVMSALATVQGDRAMAETKERAYVYHYLTLGHELLNRKHNGYLLSEHLVRGFHEDFIQTVQAHCRERGIWTDWN